MTRRFIDDNVPVQVVDYGPTLLAGVVRAILPLIERSGAATAERVGIDSLRERLSAELSGARAVFAHPLLISAWATAE
jgi:hypothetical protein